MSIVDLIFPKLCVGCGREGKYICNACQKKMLAPEQICPMCCRPSLDGWAHPKCRRHDGIERLIVGLPYRGMVQQCLKKVKYKSAWEIMSFLYGIWGCGGSSGRQNQDLGFSRVVITSVPMWRHKEQVRGFNQADILAQLIAKDCKVTNLVILERIKETKPQFGLNKKQRISNIEGAFGLLNHYTTTSLSERVILVDDVWTTGATMRECAYVLKQAGVSEVWGVALAR